MGRQSLVQAEALLYWGSDLPFLVAPNPHTPEGGSLGLSLQSRPWQHQEAESLPSGGPDGHTQACLARSQALLHPATYPAEGVKRRLMVGAVA